MPVDLARKPTRKVWCKGFSPLILYIAVVLCVILPAFCYERELNEISNRIGDQVAKVGKTRVAVVDFTDLQGNVTELGRFLAEELSIALSESAKGFRVIDRTHLRTILQEHKLAATGIIDPQTAKRLGEIAGVDALVTGTVTPFGDSIRLSVKTLDVSTAEIVGASSVDIPRTKAIDDLLAKGIAGGARPAGAPSASQQPTQGSSGAVSVEDNDFLIEIHKCSRSGKTVNCEGSITNKAERSRTFGFSYDGNYMVDDLANAYPLDRSVFKTGRAELHSQLPVKFRLRFKEVRAEASKANIVIEYNFSRGSALPHPNSKVLLRDILLQSE